MDADMRGVRSYLEGKFLGTWACARHAAPHLLAGGSMTFLTGGTGARAKLGLAAVTSTFAAVASLSQSLALELAPIRVNTGTPCPRRRWRNSVPRAAPTARPAGAGRPPTSGTRPSSS